MLDVNKIRQLIDMMVANDLVEISLRDGEVEVNLRRPNHNSHAAVVAPELAAPSLVAPTPSPGPVESAEPTQTSDDKDLVEITSPMVGTFYAASDPESPAFVKTGSEVDEDSVVCILEAMKVFNEIKAEISGRIERILVKNAQPVEYGQALFLVRPS